MTIKTIKAGLIFFIILSTSSTFAQQINFSGNWNYNKVKSDLSAYPAFVFPEQFQISMTLDSISISNIRSGPTGKTIVSPPVTFPLAGKPLERMLQGDFKRVAFCKIGEDKKTFIKNSTTSKDGQTTRAVNELWTLSADGKVLNISLTEEYAGEKPYTVKGIFEKQ